MCIRAKGAVCAAFIIDEVVESLQSLSRWINDGYRQEVFTIISGHAPTNFFGAWISVGVARFGDYPCLGLSFWCIVVPETSNYDLPMLVG